MSDRHPERLGREHRLRNSRQFDAVQKDGTAYRGRHCTVIALRTPGQGTRLGLVASRRSVGNAVRRNRARRRLRELFRRRWPVLPHQGWWVVLVAHGTAADVPHEALVEDLMGLLVAAGVLEASTPGRGDG